MNLAQTIKTQRSKKGLSQADVAHQAKVSLATLQNIEANKANPSWQTVEALAKVLGFEIELRQSKRIDWGTLTNLGCPILGDSSGETEVMRGRPSRIELVHVLNNWGEEIANLKTDSRESNAIVAWLSALKDHYPSIWKNVPTEVLDFHRKRYSREISPKLRRIALARFGEFL